MGDLVISLHPPVGSGGEPVVLHNRECGPSKDLKRTYDSSTTKDLLRFAGRVCAGTWTLKVHDQALKDSGLSFHLRLSFRLPAENVRNMLFGKRKKNNANACAVCLNSVTPRYGCDVFQSPANRTFELKSEKIQSIVEVFGGNLTILSRPALPNLVFLTKIPTSLFSHPLCSLRAEAHTA